MGVIGGEMLGVGVRACSHPWWQHPTVVPAVLVMHREARRTVKL